MNNYPQNSSLSSEEWRERANAVMPGQQSNFRRGSGAPALVLNRAEGNRCWDVDNKDYIDYVLGMGPAIWGHNNKEYLDSIKNQMDSIFSSASSIAHTTSEIELAEKITELVPCADTVRFGISGTEADQLALRLARGATGKPWFIRFEGHYHGWVDSVFGGETTFGSSEPPHPSASDADSKGLAASVRSECLILPWNDIDALRNTFQSYGDKIGLVLMEAVMCNFGCCPPKPGYLEAVRELCDEYDILLAFDEVITGFRVSIGGAQGHYGVTPDLAIFGKALAGGLPLSALAGKKKVMDFIRRNEVLGGGTFNSFPLAMAAGLCTMEMLTRDNGAAYDRISEKQESLQTGLAEIAKRHGEQVLLQGPRGTLFLVFSDLDVAYSKRDLANADFARQERYRKLLQEEGVLMAGGGRWMISAVLTDQDIEDTLRRADRAMARL